jgi:DNA-directed RNA polymerase subunit RPC12/RpoP
MSSFVNVAEHYTDGRLDWESFKAAQVANGEKCYRCGGRTDSLFGTGHRKLCAGCKDFDSDEDEVTHKSRVRCPHCRESEDVFDDDPPGDIFDEGEHDVTCSHCGREFVVETRVTYEFTSRSAED